MSAAATKMVELYPRTLAMLQLQDKVESLVSTFRRMDKDGDDVVTLFELLDLCDMERTPFMERVFTVADQDATRTLDFREFVFVVWHFATLDRGQLVGFLFDLYDRDQSGAVDKSELQAAIKDCFGKRSVSGPAKKILDKLDGEPSGVMRRKHFIQVFNSLSGALHPAVQAQQKLQQAILGKGFWERAAKQRASSAGKNMPPPSFRALFVDLMSNDLTVRGRKAKAKRVAPAP